MQDINARDYYYKKIAPKENYRSYAAVTKEYLENTYGRIVDWYSAEALNHKPFLSNDLHLQNMLLLLLSRMTGKNSAEELKRRLAKMFVVKSKDYYANAYATAPIRQEYIGDLIYFNVGLSDACFEYSMLFNQMIRLIYMRKEYGDNHEKVGSFVEKFNRNILKISAAQAEWKLNGDFIKFKDDLLIDVDEEDKQRGAIFASTTDEFILAHEIAHHLLGHCSIDDDCSEVLASLHEDCNEWHNISENHAKEFQADTFGILIISGIMGEYYEKLHIPTNVAFGLADSHMEQAMIGPLMFFTVLGQFSFDENIDSKTHPSVYSRYSQCLKVLSKYMDNERLQEHLEMISRFQALLFSIQNKGLGSYVIQDYM